MAHLSTVLGPVHPEELGVAAIHEHIMGGLPRWDCDPGFWYNTGKVLEKCYDDLIDFKLLDKQTYVDCSDIGMERDLDVYVKLAASIRPIHIVASTGFGGDKGIAPHFRKKDADYFEALFVRELTQGMGHTGIKAGVISIGSDGGELTDLEEKIYRAAARAAKRTGAAVLMGGSHTTLGQLDTLAREKLDPSRIIVSHLNGSGRIDMEYDRQIIRAGAYVAYDDIGVQDWSRRPYRMPDERRVDLLLSMTKAGLQDHVLLSTGSRSHSLSWGEPSLHNVGHLFRYFLPAMRHAGVGEDLIHKILVENPKRVLPIQQG